MMPEFTCQICGNHHTLDNTGERICPICKNDIMGVDEFIEITKPEIIQLRKKLWALEEQIERDKAESKKLKEECLDAVRQLLTKHNPSIDKLKELGNKRWERMGARPTKK